MSVWRRFPVVLVAILEDRPGFAQFTDKELAQRPQWEAFLHEAEIIAEEQLPFEEGVTEPWKLTLRKDRVVRKALWKEATGVRGGYLEGWRYEIAAYRVDKLLGVGLVPPTVERARTGRPGSCQLWIDGTGLYRDLAKRPSAADTFASDRWKDIGYIAQFFDNLIGNEDRHTGNVLVTRDLRGILIDHSRTFRAGPAFVQAIPYSAKNVPPGDLMRRLPRALVDRVSALTEEELRGAVGDLLTEAEIKAVLARRVLLLEEVRRICGRFGERDVLY